MPLCRQETQACGVTTDCCSGLICTNNTCAPPPLCRPLNGACAVTTDCCDPLICTANKCSQVSVGVGGAPGVGGMPGNGGGIPIGSGGATGGKVGSGGVGSTGGAVGTGGNPPACRTASQACAITTDCCGGLTCQGTSCLPPPVCGDGTCNIGETQANCCADCGCTLGSYCSTATKTCLAASITMRWTFADSCVDGRPIQYRLLDQTNTVLWPAALGDTFQSPADGQTVHTDIACIAGASICYGVEPLPANGVTYWGGGLTFAQACTNCCSTCGVSNPQFNLTCN